MLTAEQLALYRERLAYHAPFSMDEATLSALQWAHMSHIPYENLDILAGIPLSLQPDDLFRKLVTRRRGGFCFESQGLFKELLETIGFSVAQYAGRFLYEGQPVQSRRHRVLVVTFGTERYLLDIGVRNEAPRRALRLVAGEVQSDGVCDYRFDRDDFYGWLLMQRERGKDWKPTYGFTEEVQVDADFVPPCFYCERHPDSGFNKVMKISIFRGESNFTLVDGVFQEYRNAAVQEQRRLASREEVAAVLRECFGLDGLAYIPLR